MANKSGGIAPKVARKTYNDLGDDLNSLVNHMNNLVAHVEALNKEAWYGGAKANTWYTNMNKRYENLYKFCNGINSFRDSLGTVFKQAKTSGIEF